MQLKELIAVNQQGLRAMRLVDANALNRRAFLKSAGIAVGAAALSDGCASSPAVRQVGTGVDRLIDSGHPPPPVNELESPVEPIEPPLEIPGTETREVRVVESPAERAEREAMAREYVARVRGPERPPTAPTIPEPVAVEPEPGLPVSPEPPAPDPEPPREVSAEAAQAYMDSVRGQEPPPIDMEIARETPQPVIAPQPAEPAPAPEPIPREIVYTVGDPAERELVLLALDAARSAGADYADARISRHLFESVATREQRITQASYRESYGIGVRALVGGSWGFAATNKLTRGDVTAAAQHAAATAAANNTMTPARIELAPVQVFPNAEWTTPHSIDPFDVPIEEKAELLFRTNEQALAAQRARYVSSSVLSVKERRLVATTEGALIDQTLLRISPSVNITAISDDGRDFQTRGAVVEPAGRGWEYVLEQDLPGNAPRWAEEAAMKLSATPVEPGKWDLVLHPSHLWLTIHENVGHPTELDRALGFEANYAGTSFLSPPERVLNQTRLGPEFITFMGNRTEYGGCATVGWDDEGVPADEWPIVDKGIFVDYQTTREQAAWIAPYTGVERSHGCSYGMNWANMPFQRMPNVSLMPNDNNLSEAEVIGAVDRGIWIGGRGSYSIDQQRYNFQFGGQVFWEIRDGKKHRMLRDVAYVGRTPEFWNACALLGGKQTYYLGASFNDAKGQPGQVNAVSHGCPVALFRNIDVLNTA